MTAYPTRGPGDLPGDRHDPRSPDYDTGRDETIEARIDALMDDPRRVAEALDEIGGTSGHNSDGNTHFSADLAQVVMGRAPEAFVAELVGKVRHYFATEAGIAEDTEVAQSWLDEAEARDARRAA